MRVVLALVILAFVLSLPQAFAQFDQGETTPKNPEAGGGVGGQQGEFYQGNGGGSGPVCNGTVSLSAGCALPMLGGF